MSPKFITTLSIIGAIAGVITASLAVRRYCMRARRKSRVEGTLSTPAPAPSPSPTPAPAQVPVPPPSQTPKTPLRILIVPTLTKPTTQRDANNLTVGNGDPQPQVQSTQVFR